MAITNRDLIAANQRAAQLPPAALRAVTLVPEFPETAPEIIVVSLPELGQVASHDPSFQVAPTIVESGGPTWRLDRDHLTHPRVAPIPVDVAACLGPQHQAVLAALVGVRERLASKGQQVLLVGDLTDAARGHATALALAAALASPDCPLLLIDGAPGTNHPLTSPAWMAVSQQPVSDYCETSIPHLHILRPLPEHAASNDAVRHELYQQRIEKTRDVYRTFIISSGTVELEMVGRWQHVATGIIASVHPSQIHDSAARYAAHRLKEQPVPMLGCLVVD